MATTKDEKAAILRVLDAATGRVSPAEFHVVHAEVRDLLGVKDDNGDADGDASGDPETSEVV